MTTPAELKGRMIAAVPVPFDRDGRIDRDAQRRYVAHMERQPVDGVAVWAHTGRGLRLSMEQRAQVLLDWRAGFGGGRPLIAAAGASPQAADWDEAVTSARTMADHAAELGADALLVHPPVLARGMPDEDRKAVEYHAAVARAGLPMIVFYLYEAAGGISYSHGVLEELLARPDVLGIKVATLDSVMTFQDVARLVVERFPGKVLITGEDRFLGYSLMCGAAAALIGMAAACSTIQAALIKSHQEGNTRRFLALNAEVDRFARATFVAPMEGYVQRMLWCLVHEGVIPASSAHDPWGPELPAGEFTRLGDVLAGLSQGE
jgi:4-hydroxy-tetrahydrodipicolinate synthase